MSENGENNGENDDTNPVIEFVFNAKPYFLSGAFFVELHRVWFEWTTVEPICHERIDGDDEANELIGEDSHCNYEIYGHHDDDFIQGNQHNDYLDGGRKSDTIHGGGGADTIIGGNGEDFLFGESGRDTIFGGRGDDTIYGGSWDDLIIGGEHDDTLYGGAGIDTFVYDAWTGEHDNDTIMDYELGEIIDLSATNVTEIVLQDSDYFASAQQWQHKFLLGQIQDDELFVTHEITVRSDLVDDYRDVDFVLA